MFVTLSNDVPVVMDKLTTALMCGVVMDYEERMWSAGFRFDHPDGLERHPLAAKVERVLKEQVMPALQLHGGSISLVDVREDTAIVQFSGRCQGCGLAPTTITEGVEAKLRSAVPEIPSAW